MLNAPVVGKGNKRMNDRITTARAALEEAAKAFREYEAHHMDRSREAPDEAAAHASREKAFRNGTLAVMCEGAAALLTAQ